jgi:CPA1 family monovalent cation:H+ antiporter
LYRIAVAAAVTGAFVPGTAALQFLVVGLGGAAIGIAIGALILRLRRLTQRSDVADTTLSLLTPFAAYLAAESVRFSGVLAVVAAGVYVGRNIQAIVSPASRVQTASMSTVALSPESLIFILVGVRLPYVVRDLEPARLASLIPRRVVFACIVVVRLVWLFRGAYVGSKIQPLDRAQPPAATNVRQFFSWGGPAYAAAIPVIALASARDGME